MKKAIRKIRRILAVCAVLACLMGLPGPAAYAAPGQTALTVKQTVTGAETETFVYRLVPASAANPMPAGSGAQGYDFALTGTDIKLAGPIAFTQAGVYAYTLSRVTACACGTKGYTLRIYVEDDLSVSVVALNPDNTKAMELLFTHTCGEPEETTAPETAAPTTKPSENGPKTGDESRAGLYIALFCAAGVIVIGCAAYLIPAGKRRRQKDAGQ
ncbi:MAG: sortase B protein-sorting domain-containing protein [Firmicutes bacterium]|nr:sortase B protein-sorting domain-containing protein [Bacillota bacterium]